MSTIPSIFNQSRASYTAVGGSRRAASTGVSAVLLNRGGRYLRRTVFQELEKAGFDFVISMEGPRETYDVEELSIRFPFVKFLLLKEAYSLGEQVNIAAAEVPTPLFFLLWNDVRLAQSGGASRIAERLLGSDDGTSQGRTGRLCTVPTIQNAKYETLPTLMAPAFYKSTVKTIPFSAAKEGIPSLYPFDGIGVYDLQRFIGMGGFDGTLRSSYWQLMDFGFRAHLWGETIRSTQLMKVLYEGDIPTEDATADISYKRFYLKNLAPLYRGDSAHIPYRRFFSYAVRSGDGPFDSWDAFLEARHWVETNKFRFRCDARKLTELWENPEL